MRILHCIPSMGGGGAERQLAYLAEEFTCMGWEVHVALLSGGPNMDRLEASGAVIHPLAARSNYDPGILYQLLRTIKSVKPDLIQVWMLQMEVLGGTAAQMARVPWILSECSSELCYPPTFKIKLRVSIAFGAGAIVSNSTGGDEYWRARLGSRVPRWVIPSALPLDEIEAAQAAGPEETGLGPEQKVVLYAGRFSPEKNLETLVLALRQVVSQPGIVAVLCGDGPSRPTIERQVQEYELADRVRLPGYVPSVWSWMKRADVFVSAGLFEGQPNTVLEAMACGCPLVVSDIPAHREFLDEHNALLVDPNTPVEIAQAIGSVLSAPEAAARRAQAARARVAAWSVPAIARQYEQVYQVLMKRG